MRVQGLGVTRGTVSTQSLPTYKKPPVVEVVCGVTFDPIPDFTVPLVGKFWMEVLGGFKVAGERPPLANQIEVLDRGAGVTLFGDLFLPMPRVWLENPTGNQIVQIQRDRFLCNWRKTEAAHEYPRFGMVNGFFKEKLAEFEAFVGRTCGQKVVPRQFELTYVNHLASTPEGSNNAGNIGTLLPDFSWRKNASRFLPEPEDADLNLAFLLPDKAGRLRAKVQTAQLVKGRAQIVLLDLTARGFSPDREKWFELAHTWIVKGFEDLTSSTMNAAWEKQ